MFNWFTKYWGQWLFLLSIIISIGGYVHNAIITQKDIDIQNVYAKTHPEVYPLVALFGKTETTKHSEFNGGFFLVMGGISGSSDESNKYILKYAYTDKYGTKLMTEIINDDSDIRILEKNDITPVLKIYSTYSACGIYCDNNTQWFKTTSMKVFEVPTGTIFKGYDINLKK